MGVALCTGFGSPDFILEATRMAGIFSCGFSLHTAKRPRLGIIGARQRRQEGGTSKERLVVAEAAGAAVRGGSDAASFYAEGSWRVRHPCWWQPGGDEAAAGIRAGEGAVELTPQ
ncbi:hypothetical protein NDU88_007335 [Pleurodeles waltl]|uniref:Uncharacterized protein n=1 Tax=Pleurodeles waltl TaxID=8319 RepID=A0AAV7TZH0_PLEWA|nr:hypothetical protein NDU88_007335 [Pleurodeles waltl]